jgi:hypothetical protein
MTLAQKDKVYKSFDSLQNIDIKTFKKNQAAVKG